MNEMFEKRGPVDMSPEAIAQRLRDLQQLYLFSMSLSRARFIDATQQGNAWEGKSTVVGKFAK